MAVASQDIGRLRHLAGDDRTDVRIRLRAIDQLAALQNLYSTPKYPTPSYVTPSKRGRAFLQKALRRTLRRLKVKPVASQGMKAESACKTRLLILAGYDIGSRVLFPPLTPEGTEAVMQPVETASQIVKSDPVLEELQRIIAQAEAIALAEKSGGQKPDAEQQTA